MKVTLLGTGSAEGMPALFCECACCQAARERKGKDVRTRSSALIDDVLKIDFPPDIHHQVVANNLNLCRLEALLFTHQHDDHFVPAELQYLHRYFTTQTRTVPLPVYGPPDVIRRLRRRFAGHHAPLSFHTLRPWVTVCLADGYRVTPILAHHDPAIICYNYLIQDHTGATLLYASDTGWYSLDTWQFVAKHTLDAAVIECGKGRCRDSYKGHLCIEDVIDVRRELMRLGSLRADCPVYATHFSHLGGLMHCELQAQFSPYHITPAYDGLTFPVHHAHALPE